MRKLCSRINPVDFFTDPDYNLPASFYVPKAGDITINKINMLSEKLSLFDAYFEVSDKKAKVDDYGDETFDYALFEGKNIQILN